MFSTLVTPKNAIASEWKSQIKLCWYLRKVQIPTELFSFLVLNRKIHFSSMFMTLFSTLIFLQFIIFHPLLPNLVDLLFSDGERDWKRGRENNLCVPSYRMSIKQSKHSSSFDEMWTNTKTDRRIHKQRSVTDCLFGLEVGGKIGQKH